MYCSKIIPMNLIEQLTAKQGQQSAVPVAYTCTAENQRPAVRDEFNERELSILNKLGETGSAHGKTTGNVKTSS